MRDDPLSNPGCPVWIRKVFQAKTNPPNNLLGTVVKLEQKGDLLIRDLWAWETVCILDMQVVNTNAASYLQKTTEKSLSEVEMDNKSK